MVSVCFRGNVLIYIFMCAYVCTQTHILFVTHILYSKSFLLSKKLNIGYWFHPKSLRNFSLTFSHFHPERNVTNVNFDKVFLITCLKTRCNQPSSVLHNFDLLSVNLNQRLANYFLKCQIVNIFSLPVVWSHL